MATLWYAHLCASQFPKFYFFVDHICSELKEKLLGLFVLCVVPHRPVDYYNTHTDLGIVNVESMFNSSDEEVFNFISGFVCSIIADTGDSWCLPDGITGCLPYISMHEAQRPPSFWTSTITARCWVPALQRSWYRGQASHDKSGHKQWRQCGTHASALH